MTLVRGTLNPGGIGWDRSLRLVVALAGSDTAYPGDGEIIAGEQVVPLDAEGAFEVDLEPNSLIVPDGTRWRFNVQPTAGYGRPNYVYVLVPDGAGPYDVEDILAEQPPDLVDPDTAAVLSDRVAALEDAGPGGGSAVDSVNGRTGIVTGLAEQADLTAEVARAQAAEALLVPLTQRGAANGVATLGSDSKIPSAQLPALAIGDVFTVANQAAMLALDAQRGDVAVRTDLDPDGVFILTVDAPGVLANWVQITAPGAVISVAGRSGAVVLAKGDVGLGNVDNTSDVDKPVSTAQAAADALVTSTEIARANAAYVALAGDQTVAGVKTFSSSPVAPTPAPGDNTTKAATTAFVTAAVNALASVVSTDAELATALAGLAALYQGLDADLGEVGGLNPANDDLLQQKAGVWVNRTVAQVKTDLLTPTSGLLAARPAIGTVPEGTEYWATDVCSGSLYRAISGAWIVVGGRAEYANPTDSTLVTHANGAARSAVPGCTYTGMFDENPIHVFANGFVSHSAASAFVGFGVYVDGVLAAPPGIEYERTTVATTTTSRLEAFFRIAPLTPGSHTIALYFETISTGTGSLQGNVARTDMIIVRA